MKKIVRIDLSHAFKASCNFAEWQATCLFWTAYIKRACGDVEVHVYCTEKGPSPSS